MAYLLIEALYIAANLVNFNSHLGHLVLSILSIIVLHSNTRRGLKLKLLCLIPTLPLLPPPLTVIDSILVSLCI